MKAAVLVMLAVVTAACSRRPSIEDQLIGTWESPEVTMTYDAGTPNAPPPRNSKEMIEIVFTPDHKEIYRPRGGPNAWVATWHVEADDLVFTLDTQTYAGPPGTTRREKIKKITSDELILTDGTTDGRWTRVR